MSKLIEYVSIGICGSYGDGDYRISTEIATMDDARYAEVQKAVFGAIAAMNDMRRNEKMKLHPAQKVSAT